jgi:DUF2975 family protein
MTHSYPAPLSLSRKVLRVVIALNLLMGALIVAILITSLVSTPWFLRAFSVSEAGAPRLVMAMRLIMLLGIAATPVVHLVLTHLLAIVETVGVGNPFIVANAARLKTIAWAILALELMHVGVGLVVNAISPLIGQMHIDWGFSLTRWLAVLMLFVLARVFEQGARMREDLEGTV